MATSDAGGAGVFISYRRADASWPARWLADQLARQFGEGVVFQDVDSIRPGDDFAAAIEAAVGACSVLLAVIGPQWLAAEGDAGRRLDDPQDWVRLEIEAAIRRRVRVIPVLVDGARMPSASELPPSLQGLARRQAVALSPASLDTRRLVSVLEIALASGESGQQRTGTRAPEFPPPARAGISRLLTSALHDASALTGREKANALSEIIGAAIAVAPERVEWLTAEAETAARSIKNTRPRSEALADIAEVVAASDPGRAEAIARSIEATSEQSRALADVAGAMAAADPARAEAIARSIKEFQRSRALADVATAVAAADPERGEAIARSIEGASARSRALAGVAEVVAAADPARAEAIARSLEDMSQRPSALLSLATAVAAADPERATWLAAEAETTARSIEDASKRSRALADVAMAVAAADPARASWLAAEAETTARTIEEPELLTVLWDYGRWSALAGVATTVAAADPERAEAIARSIEDTSKRESALADVAKAMAAADPERAEAIARSIEEFQRSRALAGVAGAVAAADPERAEAIARSIKDKYWRSSALASIARFLAEPDQ